MTLNVPLKCGRTAYLQGAGLAACGHWPLNDSVVCFAGVVDEKKIKKNLRDAGLKLLQLAVGYKLYKKNLTPNLWCFFGNIYLICQLPTPCCGRGLVNKQCWAVSEVWSILSSGSGFGAFCLRRTLVQYCNMCALKPCQRIVTYCVMPFFVFCFFVLSGGTLIIVFLH